MRRLVVLGLSLLATAALAEPVRTIKIDPEPVPCDGQNHESKVLNPVSGPIYVKQVHLWQRASKPARGFADVIREGVGPRQIVLFGRWLHPTVDTPVTVSFAPDAVTVDAGESLVLLQGCRRTGEDPGVVQSVAMIWYTEAP